MHGARAKGLFEVPGNQDASALTTHEAGFIFLAGISSEGSKMCVRKVVIPVAGLGTRLLPTTRALPKEMLPVGKYPAIQHVVEELVHANLKKCLFITSHNKTIIENQFDNNVDLASQSEQNHGWNDPSNFDYSQRGIEFFYTRQQALSPTIKLRGTGAAILAAESFVDKEHFAVAYGDTIINTRQKPNFMARMIECHLRYNSACTVGIRPVTSDMVGRYGIVKPDAEDDLNADSFSIDDLVEKPGADEAPSLMAVSARYVFSPEIFDEIRRLTPVRGGELGVTDAIRGLIRRGKPVRCVRLLPDETRYDIGSHVSYYKAFIDFALQDPECGEKIQEYLEACVKHIAKRP